MQQKTIYFKDTIVKIENNLLTKRAIDTRQIQQYQVTKAVKLTSVYIIRPQSGIMVEYNIDNPNTKFFVNNYLFIAGIMVSYIYTDKGLLIRLFNSNKHNSISITPDTAVGLIKYEDKQQEN